MSTRRRTTSGVLTDVLKQRKRLVSDGGTVKEQSLYDAMIECGFETVGALISNFSNYFSLVGNDSIMLLPSPVSAAVPISSEVSDIYQAIVGMETSSSTVRTTSSRFLSLNSPLMNSLRLAIDENSSNIPAISSSSNRSTTDPSTDNPTAQQVEAKYSAIPFVKLQELCRQNGLESNKTKSKLIQSLLFAGVDLNPYLESS